MTAIPGAASIRLLLAQIANVLRRLAVEMADLHFQALGRFHHLAVEPFHRLAALGLLGLEPVGHGFDLALHESLERLELALQLAPQLARLAPQPLLEFLEAAIVIAHLRAEEDVANAVNIAALVEAAIFGIELGDIT
ncbi:MAG: hypothetical protein H0W43_00720, partial [Chthoniobacterales bacterium]|nr:hypothetical protein [Chthoniobacterales bacterium]